MMGTLALDHLLDRLRVYRSIFEIRYLIQVRKLLVRLLTQLGLPPELIRTHLCPLVSPYLPDFDRFRYYQYQYSTPAIQILLRSSQAKAGQVRILVSQPTPDSLQAKLHLPSLGQPYLLTQDTDLKQLDQLIHYCYCFYQLGDTSLVQQPTCLAKRPLPVLTKK